MIELPSAYNGRPSGGLTIPPGVYADDDPRLLNLAEYLVETRHAIRVGTFPDAAEVATLAGKDAPSADGAAETAVAVPHAAEGEPNEGGVSTTGTGASDESAVDNATAEDAEPVAQPVNESDGAAESATPAADAAPAKEEKTNKPASTSKSKSKQG